MQIKIEIVGAQEELTEVLNLLAGVKKEVAIKKAAETVKEQPTSTGPTEDNSKEEKTDNAAVKPTVTFEQLREMIASKNKTPDRKGKALIAKFGFTKLDEVRPRPDVWDQMYAEAKEL